MKVAVIGYGNVGMAMFALLINMPEVHEVALVGRNVKRIEGEIADMRDCLAISGNPKNVVGGGYENLKGADIIIYTAGPSIKNTSQSRLDILQENLKVAKNISDEINKYNKDAIIIVISNPVDLIVQALMKYTGRPKNRVIGTGTLLDTARLQRAVADMLDMKPENIKTFVLGEHGASSCIVWSWSRVFGYDMEEYINKNLPEEFSLNPKKLLEANRRAGLNIFENKGSTSFGVASAAAKITDAIIYNTNEILPVSTYLEGEYGIDGLALSLPCSVNKNGAFPVSNVEMTEEELAALHESAEKIREAKGDLL